MPEKKRNTIGKKEKAGLTLPDQKDSAVSSEPQNSATVQAGHQEKAAGTKSVVPEVSGEYVVRKIPERFRKPNYYKYQQVKGSLIEMLDGSNTAAQVVEALHVTQQTLFKYKALAQLETGLDLKTLEEKIHLERNLKL